MAERADRSIDWRETFAVLQALKTITMKVPQGLAVVVAKDSNIAKTAIN